MRQKKAGQQNNQRNDCFYLFHKAGLIGECAAKTKFTKKISQMQAAPRVGNALILFQV
jgi:hypothetical protein